MHDLIIRNGTIVDGTGRERFSGDIAIDDGTLTEVGEVSGKGRRELDAHGQVVAPGWVDIHTHYDGQVTFDPWLSPSTQHGVTTVAFGNCGVWFAPCRARDRETLINVRIQRKNWCLERSLWCFCCCVCYRSYVDLFFVLCF